MVLFTNFGRPYQLTNGKKIGLFEMKNHLKQGFLGVKSGFWGSENLSVGKQIEGQNGAKWP